MGVSHNTVRKYVLRAQAARAGTIEEIAPRDREIHQPDRVVTPEIRGIIHCILEKTVKNPKSNDAMPNSSGIIFTHPTTH